MSVAPLQLGSKARLLRPDFPLEQRIAEAAAVIAHPCRGNVVALARRHGVSRQTASAIVGKVRRACAAALAPLASGRPSRSDTIVVDHDRVAAAVVALATDAHASNAGTQACIQTMLDRHVSTGRISAILHDAAERATQQLQALPMPSQPVFAATDELYDHGHPVLALIEDEHLGVLLISKEDEADATTWGVRFLELQQRGLQYAHLVKDQGAAMAAGIADAGILPDSACGSDVFHCLLTFGREARALAHQATRAQTAFEKLDAALDYHTAPAHGRGHPPQQTTLEAYARAADAAAGAAHLAADVQFLFHQTRAILQPVDAHGQLIPPAAATADLESVAELLGDLGPRCRPLAKLIAGYGPALQSFRPLLAERHEHLRRQYGADLVQFVAWTWVHRRALHERLPRTPAELLTRWGLDAPLAAVADIWHTFRNSHRASSVIESFNSQLRLHVHAHRGLTPSLLPLIVYRHNVRPFPRGVHRGQAPFVALGILPTDSRSWIDQLFHPTPSPDLSQVTTPGQPTPTPTPEPASKDAHDSAA